eukprot:gene1026-1391_t
MPAVPAPCARDGLRCGFDGYPLGSFHMSTGWIILGVIVVLVLFAFAAYNRLVALSQRVNQAFADIDVQLKQRHDLIPNLVETVKGYASHERGTLDDVVKARNSAMSAQGPGQVAAAENQLSGALGRLIALSEAYPDLKANENFVELQKSLETIEGEIQMARRYYNGSARDLNIKVESFPSNLLAGPFGFQKKPFFEIDNPADRAVPTRLIASLFLLAVALIGASPAAAMEVIRSFHSDIVLDSSGQLTVTETIDVDVENQKIRHGIYRDLPLTFKGDDGEMHRVDFSLISIRRDGQPEEYKTESLDSGVRMVIGKAEVMVPVGPHSYEIKYQTGRQIRYFPDHDELFWNVTGNGW